MYAQEFSGLITHVYNHILCEGFSLVGALIGVSPRARHMFSLLGKDFIF